MVDMRGHSFTVRATPGEPGEVSVFGEDLAELELARFGGEHGGLPLVFKDESVSDAQVEWLRVMATAALAVLADDYAKVA